MDDVESKLFKPPGECMNTDKEENRKMREKISNSPTSISSNEYYEESWRRFRKSYDVKNKYHPPGESHYFGDYKYHDSTQWNEKLLTKMHSTIRMEGRPDGKSR